MNEKRFIQLINLYIDGEISPSELEELEREVAADPRRRDIYQSYCRLQQAAKKVFNQFGEALTETVDLKKYQILDRHSFGLRGGVFYSVGALVAACVSVVAAVALFQDSEWSSSANRSYSGPGSVAVEVFEPSRLNKTSYSVRMATHQPPTEPVSFFGAATRPQAPAFQPASGPPTIWETNFRPASAGKAIRGKSSFDAPELASFQFQR